MRFIFEWIAMRKEAAEALKKRDKEITQELDLLRFSIETICNKSNILRNDVIKLKQEVHHLQQSTAATNAPKPKPGFEE